MIHVPRILMSLLLIATLAGTASAEVVGSQPLPIGREVFEGEPGRGLLDCSTVIEVELGVLYTMNNGDGSSNVDAYDCWPWSMTGPELVFHVIMPDRWQVTLTQMAADVDGIILKDDCDEGACWYAWDYQYVWTNTDEPGEYWFVVDGYNGAVGEFAILFEELGPQGPACESLHQPFPYESGDIVPPGTYEVSGNNCGASNTLYDICGEFLGLDDWWEINLLPGASLQAEIAINYGDCGLCLVDVCEDPAEINCLAWADANGSGMAEVVSYTNDTGEIQTIYLVVDNVAAEMDACDGLYEGTIQLEGEAVSDDSMSWSRVKALFR